MAETFEVGTRTDVTTDRSVRLVHLRYTPEYQKDKYSCVSSERWDSPEVVERRRLRATIAEAEATIAKATTRLAELEGEG